jgi:hypothetical protein
MGSNHYRQKKNHILAPLSQKEEENHNSIFFFRKNLFADNSFRLAYDRLEKTE